MGRRISASRTTPSTGRSLLAYWRIKRGLTQQEMARHTGIPIATYRRLEKGTIRNPRIGWLTNCAWVLWIDPVILHSEYGAWVPQPTAKRPPVDPTALHHEGRFSNIPDPSARVRQRP